MFHLSPLNISSFLSSIFSKCFHFLGSVLIFVTKKANSEELAHNLQAKEFDVKLIHGDLNQVSTNYHETSNLNRQQILMQSTSVTRFGEISPLWQTFLSLWLFSDGLFSIWQTFKPTLAMWCAFGQFFIVVNGQKMKHNLAIWSHCRAPPCCFPDSSYSELNFSTSVTRSSTRSRRSHFRFWWLQTLLQEASTFPIFVQSSTLTWPEISILTLTESDEQVC